MIEELIEAAAVCIRAAVIEVRRSDPVPDCPVSPEFLSDLQKLVIASLASSPPEPREHKGSQLRELIERHSIARPEDAMSYGTTELKLLQALSALREAVKLVRND